MWKFDLSMLETVFLLDQLRPDLILAYIVLNLGRSFLTMGLSQESYSSIIDKLAGPMPWIKQVQWTGSDRHKAL